MGRLEFFPTKLPTRNQDGRVPNNMKSVQTNFNLEKAGILRYFRLLGLKRGECRIPVIRAATQAMAVTLSEGESLRTSPSHTSRVDSRRAEVAFAAYKLLDPRGRKDLYERVQLSYSMDQEYAADAELPAMASNALVDKMPTISEQDFPLVRTTHLGRRGRDQEKSLPLMSNQVMEDLIGLPSFSDASETSLDERREVIRLIREEKPETERRSSALEWLWSRIR
jgi:hypothetical protein